MFKRILIPLDGSDIAEAAIPYGEALARRLGSEVTLLHACDESHQFNHTMHRLYLEKRAEMIAAGFSPDAGVDTAPVAAAVIQFGQLAPVIHDYVNQYNTDLIIMIREGLSAAPKSRSVASVFDDVFRVVGCPSMLVPPEAVVKGKPLFNHILVPLDGSPGSEQALAPAAALAQASGAEITLFSMVKETLEAEPESDLVGDRGLHNMKKSLDEQDQVFEYLESLADKLRQDGLEAAPRVDIGDNSAHLITSAARVLGADMVVMATASVVSTWRSKSVTHKLLAETDLPLMVVRQQ